LDGLAVGVGSVKLTDGVASIARVWHGHVCDATGAVLAVVEKLNARDLADAVEQFLSGVSV
jgi:hypothetical protein